MLTTLRWALLLSGPTTFAVGWLLGDPMVLFLGVTGELVAGALIYLTYLFEDLRGERDE